MKPLQKINPSIPKENKESAIKIKFGCNYYKIFSHNIAYIYKKEGVHFIANKKKFKLPLFINNINEILLDLNSKNFFMLNESTIFSKNFVRLKESENKCYAIAFNSIYEDSFLIPENLQSNFKSWILD
jgi:hypothetical protein